MEYKEFPEHKKRARELIDFDPLDTAYNLNDNQENNDTLVLGMGLMALQNEGKRMVLSELCDTYYRMPWEEAQEVVAEEGFVITGHYELQGSYGDVYQQFVAAHPASKLVLTAQSHEIDGRDVLDHNMKIYATVDTHGDHEVFMNLFRLHPSSRYVGDGSKEDNRFAMDWTVTDGLKLTLEALEKSGAAFVDWVKPADEPHRDFHFFANEYYRNRQNGSTNEKEARILADLPEWARAFMNK